MRQLSLTVSWDLRAYLVFSVVLEVMHEASPEPLKGAVSAQRALQGSETEARELLGGTKKNSVHPEKGSLICLDGEIGALKFLEPSRWARELAGGFDGFPDHPAAFA